MAAVLQRPDRERISWESSGEVSGTSLPCCSDEVKGELAHCRRLAAKGNVDTYIYLLKPGKFTTNSTEPFHGVHCLRLYFCTVDRKAFVFTHVLRLHQEDWFRYKTILCSICPHSVGKQAGKKRNPPHFPALLSRQRTTPQLKFKL